MGAAPVSEGPADDYDRPIGNNKRAGSKGAVPLATTEDSAPLATLRGAGVEVDARRVARFTGGALVVLLAVLTALLALAGAHKNGAIAALESHGTRTTMTVTGCRGLMGGSGTNLAGYSCSGTLTVGGRTYHDPVPGTADNEPGSTLSVVTDRSDPHLVSTASILAHERPSAKVFILPGVLAAVLIGLLALAAGRRDWSGSAPRRGRRRVATGSLGS